MHSVVDGNNTNLDEREEIVGHALENFTKFGSKRFSMDELAQSLGISKKTLYKHFDSKEELVSESLGLLLGRIKMKIQYFMAEQSDANEPLSTIIYIYKLGLITFQELNPSFLFGLAKYYPKAFSVYSDFKKDIVWQQVFPLLKRGQELGQIRKSVNVELVCALFLSRMEDIVNSKANLFEEYSIQELLEHIIINNLKGILTLDYLVSSNLKEWPK